MSTISLSILGIFFTILLVDYIDGRNIYQEKRDWNRVPGNPGVKIRLTKKGINHLKTVGVKLLNEQISQLQGYHTDFEFSQPGIQGHCNLTNIRVLQYNPPRVSVVNFLPPQSVVIGLENMDVSLAGSFNAIGGVFQVAGDVDGSLVGLTVALTTDFYSNAAGQMEVNVRNCSTLIDRSHFNINPAGPLGPLVKTLEGFINEQVRQRIPTMFCKKLKTLIEDSSPRVFAKLTRTNFEDHFKGEFTDKEVIKKFVANFVRGLYIDNQNIYQPLVTYDYFETQHKGEILYVDSQQSTPFYPNPMNTSPQSDRMIHFFASEYLFTSLLYQAYQGDKLRLELHKGNLPEQYRGLVSTTCNGEGGGLVGAVCVGKLIPAIAEAYPNATTAFDLIPHGLPDFSFNGEVGAIRVSSRIITYLDQPNGRRKQIIVSDADGQADIMLSADEGKLSGELKLNKLKVRLHRSSVPLDPSSIEQLTPLAKTFIGPQLNQAMKKGIPFPLKESITFVDPKIQIHDGYVELGTDFILGEDVLRKKIKETFADILF